MSGGKDVGIMYALVGFEYAVLFLVLVYNRYWCFVSICLW